MHIELLIALFGIAMIVVGISGHGLKVWCVHMPPTQSMFSRICLIMFGAVLAVWGLLSHHPTHDNDHEENEMHEVDVSEENYWAERDRHRDQTANWLQKHGDE